MCDKQHQSAFLSSAFLTFCLPCCCEYSQDLVGRVPAVNPALENTCFHGCSCTGNLRRSILAKTFWIKVAL